jgi:hypothetical protein
MREELIGVFGLSWQEQIAKDLYNIYSDKSLKYNAIMAATHGSSWNTAYINQIESAYKLGKANGLSGTALSDYMTKTVSFSKPAMADTYVKTRDSYSGSSFANAVSSVANPIIKTAGSAVSTVATPLTGIVLGVAAIAVIGLIIYSKSKKGG